MLFFITFPCIAGLFSSYLVPRRPPTRRDLRTLPSQEVGTTLLLVPRCMGELAEFNEFCTWLENTIENDEVSLQIDETVSPGGVNLKGFRGSRLPPKYSSRVRHPV